MIIRYSPRSENLENNEKDYIDKKLKKVHDLLENRGEKKISFSVEANKNKHVWNFSTSAITLQKNFRVSKQDKALLKAVDMTESVLTKQIRESFGKENSQPRTKIGETQNTRNAPLE